MGDYYSGNGSNPKVLILMGAVLALLGASFYNVMQINQLRAELTETRTLVDEELAKSGEEQAETPKANRATAEAIAKIEAMKEELQAAQEKAAQLAGEARVVAVREADAVEAKLKEAQEAQAAEAARLAADLSNVSQQVTAVQSDTNSNRERVAAVTTEVAAVRAQAENTKAELQKTIASLTATQGDLGIQSGLIATNARELNALRERGERAYTEFRLPKSKSGQRIGELQIRVTKTDAKKNRYTIEVIADDKKVEKKDRTTNEPVQFMISRYRQPLELVVNEVRKDMIIGYLSTPKVAVARN